MKRESSGAWPVARHLVRSYRLTVAIFLGLVVLVWTLVNVILIKTGVITETEATNIWRWMVVPPAKYFLFTVAIIVAAVQLRVYVAHGLTRRDITIGSGLFFAPLAAVFAAATLVIFGAVTATWAMWGTPSPAPTGQVAWATALALLAYLAYACSGWLVGIGFARFGAWGGIAFIPVAVLPAASAEGLYYVTNLATTAGALAVVVLGAWLAPMLARGVVVRKVAG